MPQESENQTKKSYWQLWQEKSFSKEQIRQYLKQGFAIDDYMFVTWLRDSKKINLEQVNKNIIYSLRKDYQQAWTELDAKVNNSELADLNLEPNAFSAINKHVELNIGLSLADQSKQEIQSFSKSSLLLDNSSELVNKEHKCSSDCSHSCDYCQCGMKKELMFFSDSETNVDFCSAECYSSWLSNPESSELLKWRKVSRTMSLSDLKAWKKLNFDLADYQRHQKLVKEDKVTHIVYNVGWKDFLSWEAFQKEFIKKIGLIGKSYSYSLIAYWKEQGILPTTATEFEQLLERGQPAQYYLDLNYPINDVHVFSTENKGKQRNEITSLKIGNCRLVGTLNLSDFVNLEELNCANNQLAKLDVSQCLNLKTLACFKNQLAQLILPTANQLAEISISNNQLANFNYQLLNPKTLTKLSVWNNWLPMTNIAVFSQLVNLEILDIGNDNEAVKSDSYNRFFGSLNALKNLTTLKNLFIANTDINQGLEYLPESLETFLCYSSENTYLFEVREIRNIFRQQAFFLGENYKPNNWKIYWENWISIPNAQEWWNARYSEQSRSEKSDQKNREKKFFITEQLKGVIDLGNGSYSEIFIYPEVNEKLINFVNKKTHVKIVKLLSAQKWLDKNYPKEKRTHIKKLNIRFKNLTGRLDLKDFINLEELDCGDNHLTDININKNAKLIRLCCHRNQLTELDISKNLELSENLCCYENQLTSLDLTKNTKLIGLTCNDNHLSYLGLTRSHTELTGLGCNNNESVDIIKILKQLPYPEKMTELAICGNNISSQDLSMFGKFINLERFWLKDNNFYGSLEPLYNLNKLKEISIGGTNINDGFQYFPNLEKMWCENCEEMEKELKDYSNEVKGEDDGKIYYYYNPKLWRENQETFKYLKKALEEINPHLNINELLKNIFFNVKTGEFRGNLQFLTNSLKNQVLLEKKTKEMLELELRIQELTNLVKNQKEKIVNAYLCFASEKELLQKVVKAHLEYNKAKKQRIPSRKLKKRFEELEKELETKLTERLKEELMEEVELILTDCEQLTNWETELEEKLNNKILLIEGNENLQTELKLVKLIGRGAFGEVYLGKYKKQEVAAKKFNISFNFLDKEDLVMIKDELDLLSKLNHSNIINFLGAEQKDSHLYLIMELANNGSLTDYINQHKDKTYTKGDWKTNYNFILNITRGLEYLHSKEIVHRDLKSMNILISNQIAKLADFGLAKVKTFNTEINAKNTVGTLRWMAPEILTENKPHTFASDIYSLGMIFWEIVAKRLPYSHVDGNLIICQIVAGHQEIIPIDTPAELAEIISFCWRAEPSERISLTDIASELKTLIEVPPK